MDWCSQAGWQAASPPIDASTPERSAYWAAGCKWYSLA